MLCNRFLVAPQFCINSLELAELGELNYFLAGIGSYEAAFFLSTVVVQQLFSATNNLLTGQTGRLVSLCNQTFLGESSVTKELGQHRAVPGYFTSISSSCEATVTEGCVSRHPFGRLCNRLYKGIFMKKLPVQLTCHHQFSVTGEPVVSTGFEAGFLPVRMGTADFSVTGNTLCNR